MNNDTLTSAVTAKARQLKIDNRLLLVAIGVVHFSELEKKSIQDSELEEVIVLKYSGPTSENMKDAAEYQISKNKHADAGHAALECLTESEIESLNTRVKSIADFMLPNGGLQHFHVVAIKRGFEQIDFLKLRYPGKTIRQFVLEVCGEEYKIFQLLAEIMEGDFNYN